MNRTRPFVNRFVKRKQQQIQDSYHSTNLKDIKPMNTKLMEHSQTIFINHGKREMIKQVRQVQIERQNKLLLQKITSVMGKNGAYSVSKTKNIRTKVSKSLNQIYRKRQLQNIQLQNKRFLQRLQSKRPTLNIQKINKDWVQNKSTIRRMSNVEFYLTNIKSSSRVKSITSQRFYKSKYQKMKLLKTKLIDGEKILIKIEFVGDILKIVGDSQNSKDIKIIEIPKDQAIMFIEQDCQGKFQLLVQKLKYDHQAESLYLVSQHLQQENPIFTDFNPEIHQILFKGPSNKKTRLDDRRNKSGVQNVYKPIKEVSHQSIDPFLQKSKTINIVAQVKISQKKISQEQKQAEKANENFVPIVKEPSNGQNQHLQKMGKKKENYQNIQAKLIVQVQKQTNSLQKENKNLIKDQEQLEQRKNQEEQKKNQAELINEVVNQEIVQNIEKKQKQAKKKEQQIIEQPHKSVQDRYVEAGQKTIIQQPQQKNIIVVPESPEDYNQQFQSSAEAIKVERKQEMKKNQP